MSIKKLICNKQFIIGVIILICATSAAIGYYKYISYYPSTDDAYIKAYIVQIAPNINGNISSINITNNEYVKKGTLLFTIDKKPYQIAVNKAKTDLLQAEQNVKLSKSNAHVAQVLVNEANTNYLYSKQTYKRNTYLNKKHIVSNQQEDETIKNFNVSKEKLASALSILKQKKLKIDVANSTVKESNIELNNAELNLSYTKIYAPADGYVSNFHLAAGEYINIGEQLFAFIESDQWWIKANFKETDLRRIKPGQDVNVYIDMYGKNISGKVQSIAYGSGSTYSLIPSENATGNWVKVTQRFPVRILVKNNNLNAPLRVGSTVNVTVNTVS
ncbi:MAG TPA: HlyD family secretion protein [Victivallales bacterium]|nr:HlyD family secretion protein [Victivallales bacterium]